MSSDLDKKIIEAEYQDNLVEVFGVEALPEVEITPSEKLREYKQYVNETLISFKTGYENLKNLIEGMHITLDEECTRQFQGDIDGLEKILKIISDQLERYAASAIQQPLDLAQFDKNINTTISQLEEYAEAKLNSTNTALNNRSSAGNNANDATIAHHAAVVTAHFVSEMQIHHQKIIRVLVRKLMTLGRVYALVQNEHFAKKEEKMRQKAMHMNDGVQKISVHISDELAALLQ